jgi:hypothetical protein
LNLPLPKSDGSPLVLSWRMPRYGERSLALAIIGLVALAGAIANGILMGLGMPMS